MKTTLKDFYKSLSLLLFFSILLCFIYPLVIFLFGRVFIKNQADGSLLKVNNKIIGSKLLGQKFSSDIYFHSRPSINNYYGIKASSSNFSQTSQVFLNSVEKLAKEYRAENMVAEDVFLPNDAVTYSASGLDPHITLQNAQLQIKRIAKKRNTSETNIQDLIKQSLEKHTLFSPEKLNVLFLNLELDKKFPINTLKK